MKDMYSFSPTQAVHELTYERVVEAYHRVYARLGLGDITYRTYADGGIFTPRFSDEFQTLSDVGEDRIFVDEAKKIAINEEIMTDENLEKLGLTRDNLVERRGVEVGNTFHLESKYTDALGVYFADDSGAQQSIIMGCYGIGVSRLMGVIAEHFSDDKGLVWPVNIAPFAVYLVSIGEQGTAEADKLYEELTAAGVEVLYDDRDERPGAKFADAELMGIPYRLTVSDRLVEQNKLELTERRTGETQLLTATEALAILEKLS
jgi:prolyl-tRNA synthetase